MTDDEPIKAVDTDTSVLSCHACWEPELPDALWAALQVAAGFAAVLKSFEGVPEVFLERMGLQRLLELVLLGSLEHKSGQFSSKHWRQGFDESNTPYDSCQATGVPDPKPRRLTRSNHGSFADVQARMALTPDLWKQRPLPAELVQYAADDVTQLLTLAAELAEDVGLAGLSASLVLSKAQVEWYFDPSDRTGAGTEGNTSYK